MSKTWSEGPKMNTKRWRHACFADEATSSIFVIGGYDDLWNELNSTEKWTFGQNSWEPSANLPVAIEQSSAVSSDTDEFIGYMAGGNTGTHPDIRTKYIYGLRRREKTWIKLNKTMKMGRRRHSLFNIPANQVLGC